MQSRSAVAGYVMATENAVSLSGLVEDIRAAMIDYQVSDLLSYRSKNLSENTLDCVANRYKFEDRDAHGESLIPADHNLHRSDQETGSRRQVITFLTTSKTSAILTLPSYR